MFAVGAVLVDVRYRATASPVAEPEFGQPLPSDEAVSWTAR